jgi:restriction system protein
MDQFESIVPIWPMFVYPTLVALAEGDTLSRRELGKRAMDILNLSQEARDEALESGGSRAEGRAGWAITHLNKAGWIERPSRAHYRITADGRTWMAAHPEGINDFGSANRVFAPYWPKQERTAMTASVAVVDADTNVDPIEQIELGIARVGAEVVDALLARLRGSDPGFFEEAVVKVLLAMGYGGTEQRGKRIGGTGDGGVDGVIDQDALGLDQIYVQAKRYADGNTVGRETIQAFIGALQGFGATRGVFITSSTFTANARDFANAISTRVILIDGQRLAQLMIKYRVGVQVKQSYEVVEIDEDFFE